jgi:RimJ/RimL family protein N-acetyltransferase
MHARVRARDGEIRQVLVYFGGADSENLTGLAVEALLGLGRSDIAVDVVVDPAHPEARPLEAIIRSHRNFTLYGRLPTLAPLMMKADLAVGAGGATSWERCCLGLPALVITLAENQKPIAAELDRLGVLRWLGHKGEVSAESLRQALEELASKDISATWSRRALSMVDGLGAARVAETLLLSGRTPLRARLVEPRDEELLLCWANDPLVRSNSFAQESISPGNHHRWFQKRLADDACRIYVLETELGHAVGQVRFELEGERWVIDYSIDARFRRRGLGGAVLSTAIETLVKDVGTAPLRARVKTQNMASLKVFESLGFVRDSAESSDGVHHFIAE